jgi:hypothetical protein
VSIYDACCGGQVIASDDEEDVFGNEGGPEKTNTKLRALHAAKKQLPQDQIQTFLAGPEEPTVHSEENN